MGIMDSVKKAVQGRSTKVADAVDTAVEKVDQRTKGKYTDKLTTGAEKIKDTVSKLDREADATDGSLAGDDAPGHTGKVTGTPPPTGPDASDGASGDDLHGGTGPVR